MHRSLGRLSLLVAVLTGACTLTTSGTAVATPGPSARAASVDRVLVISLPRVAWRDLRGVDLPNLARFFAESAVADMTNRTIGRRDLAAAYLTIGAGTRSASTGLPDDGEGLGVDEPFGLATAADTLELRTLRGSAARAGSSRAPGVAQLGIETITRLNDDQDVDVTVGALGDALARGGFTRLVVGNGDGLVVDPDTTTYRRFAVNALMRSDGTVPEGRVDDGLLDPDPSAPFGVRSDVAATVDAFRAGWKPRTVALVEASDLARASDFLPLASPRQRSPLLHDALRRADDLVGDLLTEVDPARDAVLVVAPAPSNSGDPLTVAALRAPGVRPGLLRSASTRRDGFVLLADIAPTIVDLVGLPRDKHMSGSPFVARSTTRGDAQRRGFLVDASKAARFRDEVRGPVTITYAVAQGLLALAAYAILRRRARGQPPGTRALALMRFCALAALGFVPAVYLARLVAFQDHGQLAFWAAITVAALALAAVYRAAGRFDPTGPLMLALGAVVALQIGDVLLGARLQFGSAFGYSPTIGVRVAGFGNISFAFLSSATLLLAGLVAHRVGGRRGAQVAIGMLAVALVVDVAPFWGSDFGGILSMVPAFAVAGALLLGIRPRIRLRTVVVLGVATVLVLAVAAAIDLSRPVAERTHVGRLVDSVSENGAGKLWSVVARKLNQNLATLGSSDWRLVLPFALLLVGYLLFARARWGRRIVEWIPEMRPAIVGFVVLAVLGYALNDSGIAIPAVMLSVLDAALIWLVLADEVQRAPADSLVVPSPAELSRAGP